MLKLTIEMKIFFDARYIRTDFHDGISRYGAELGLALSKLTPVTFMICDEAQKKLLPPDANCILIHKPTSAKEPFTSLILNRYHPDVVFSPMQTMGSFGHRFKLILTIHDLIYFHHPIPPRQLSFAVRVGWRIFHMSYIPERIVLNGADAIVTVSEMTKKELIKVRATYKSITVVPDAPQKLLELTSKPVNHDKTGPRNLVYMGSFMPYKNAETLIASMHWLPNHTLHLLSRITPKRKAEFMANMPANAHVVFHNGVTDEQYATLLADNAVLVTASRDEGYGLPIAEALAMGVPAVVSELPIFHEVAGEGALYADPNNPHDFADNILKLDDTELREAIIEKGTQHIKQFSWPISAQILLDLAKSLV